MTPINLDAVLAECSRRDCDVENYELIAYTIALVAEVRRLDQAEVEALEGLTHTLLIDERDAARVRVAKLEEWVRNADTQLEGHAGLLTAIIGHQDANGASAAASHNDQCLAAIQELRRLAAELLREGGGK